MNETAISLSGKFESIADVMQATQQIPADHLLVYQNTVNLLKGKFTVLGENLTLEAIKQPVTVDFSNSKRIIDFNILPNQALIYFTLPPETDPQKFWAIIAEQTIK